MPRFAANLSMMYPEFPFLDRFAAARADGFEGVEFTFPYQFPAEQIATRLKGNDLTTVLFNASPGDFAAGERGTAALPGREQDFTESVELAISYAKTLGCKRVHFMAGLMTDGLDRAVMRTTYVANLREACARLAELDITALIEPINTRDMPGYFLNRQDEADAVITEVAVPNLKILMDFYHAQIVEGDLARKYELYRQHVGHVQIAGVPYRNEPNTGEVNYPFLFELLDRLGYSGWVGCEYRPAGQGPGGTSEGLEWFRQYRSQTQARMRDGRNY